MTMKIKKLSRYWLLAASAGFILGTAQAENLSDSLQIKVLSAACANCHGTDGNQGGAVPVIAGRPAGVLESQLLAFKRGEAPKATVMPRHAAGYTDDELAALANYFSKLGR